MKPFLSPTTPAAYLTAFFVLLIAMPFGRYYTGDGELWTICGGIALMALFAYIASKWSALNQLGMSFSRWFTSALKVALSATGILAAATSASSSANQYANPYYKFYDVFLVTNSQPVNWANDHDVTAAGQDTWTILATFGVTFTFLFLAALIGIAIGVSEGAANRWGLLVIGIAIAGLFLGFAYAQMYWDYAFAVGAPIPRSSIVWITVGIGALVVAITAAVTIARTPRFIK